MAGKRADPPPREPGEVDRRRDGEQAPGAERCGPVTISRLAKDDGRALILYTVTPATP